MVKRLLGLALLTGVMFIGMGFVAPTKAEAGNVKHRIRYSSNYTKGVTSIKRLTSPYDYAGRVFRTGSSGYILIDLGWISSGQARSYAKVNPYSDTKYWNVPWYSYTLDLNCTGY